MFLLRVAVDASRNVTFTILDERKPTSGSDLNNSNVNNDTDSDRALLLSEGMEMVEIHNRKRCVGSNCPCTRGLIWSCF